MSEETEAFIDFACDGMKEARVVRELLTEYMQHGEGRARVAKSFLQPMAALVSEVSGREKMPPPGPLNVSGRVDRMIRRVELFLACVPAPELDADVFRQIRCQWGDLRGLREAKAS